MKRTLFKKLFVTLLTGISTMVFADNADGLKTQLDIHKDLVIDNNPAAYRILFVGDSITLHGVGDWTRQMGWDHEAGMAASKAENDYVHLLTGMIQDKLKDRKVQAYYHIYGGGGSAAERLSAINKVMPVKPHLVVIQLGEHEKSLEDCRVNYQKLLQAFAAFKPTPQIICVGVWNPSGIGKAPVYQGGVADLNNVMRDECAAMNIPFASVEKYALSHLCSGWGTHPGVQWHPNDKGHQGYAQELFNAFITLKTSN